VSLTRGKVLGKKGSGRHTIGIIMNILYYYEKIKLHQSSQMLDLSLQNLFKSGLHLFPEAQKFPIYAFKSLHPVWALEVQA
jgi:hypothetical protein